MENILNRPAIKAEARNFIRQDTRWGKMTLATIVIYLLGGFVNFYINIGRTVDKAPISYKIGSGNGVISLLLIPFTIAIAGYYLNYIRGFNPEWKSLYKEGFDRYGKYFGTGFIVGLFTSLWFILLIVPGIVMGIAYSQTKYIIHDNSNLRPTDAIEMSKRMTNGFKGDLFTMYLSFFWWYMLAAITGGIFFIYVIPYVETTSAMYYENLKRNAIDNGVIAPEAFGIMPNRPQNNSPTGFSGQQNAAPNYPNQPSSTESFNATPTPSENIEQKNDEPKNNDESN